VITRQFSIARYWEQYHNYNPNWLTTPNFADRTRPLFDTIGRSMKNYENIRLNDPTGPLADDSIMAMGNSYFLRGRYNDADAQYELLRKEYSRSDHQYDAHILGLQCKLRKYQGPSYDGTPLEEAQVLVKQLKVQFNGQLDPDQRERLAEVDGLLKKEIATRDFQMAQHFDGIKHYGSARIYYARVMKDFPNTPLAEQSKVRLAAIGGEPETPTSIIEPVLELLPENSERTKIATVPLVEPNAPATPVRSEIMTASGQQPVGEGSAALNLAYVACGRMDAHWAHAIHPWDAAAGVLLVQEAGGAVTAADGQPFDLVRADYLAAATIALHTRLVPLIS
jgi:tetratricopeptide (TPR) repeat protein